MKGKIKHITIALGICLLLAMIVLGLKNRNTIYTRFLGDVQTLYMQADSLYRQKNMRTPRHCTQNWQELTVQSVASLF